MVPIDTLEQLETSELEWFVGKQNYFYDHFDDKEDMIERRVTLPEGKDVFKIIEYSLQKMLESPNTYALIYRLNAVELAIAITYADDEGRYRFHIGSDTLLGIPSIFFLQNSAIYKHELSLKILLLHQNGL